MQTYETLFVTTPTLTEDEERTTIESLSQIVTDGGGTLVANDRLGRRRLAYPIQKQIDGVYVRFLYDSEPAVPKELERRLGLSERVLRALTVRLDLKWAAAAKQQVLRDAQARADAAERALQEGEDGLLRSATSLGSVEPAVDSDEDDFDRGRSGDDDDGGYGSGGRNRWR